jgi:hypothetical protein
MLPDQGSNLESLDPESSVLPITPSGKLLIISKYLKIFDKMKVVNLTGLSVYDAFNL